MNTGRMVVGVILFAIGALLAVLSFALPPDKVMFMIGDTNMPLVPAAILGIVGVALMLSALRSEKAGAPSVEKALPEPLNDPKMVALNKRLEAMGWGFFLIMLGGFSLVPGDVVSKGYWSIGLGLIMLGLNGARYYYGIKMSGFTTFIGVLSLLTGVTQLLGFSTLDGALFLILLGAYLLLKPWFERKELFGKVQES